MARVRILTGTRDELAGEAVGAGNVWERTGHDGLSVRLAFEDRDLVVARGDTFEAGGEVWRVVAIEPYAPTGGYEVVVEPAVEPGPSAPPDARPSTPPPVWVEVSPRSGGEIAAALRAQTPDLLAALDPGSPVRAVARWDRESHDRFTDSWPGERLGPSTTERRTAVLAPPDGAEAHVTVETTRRSPDDVAFVEVRGTWQVGGARASCWGRGDGLAPITRVALAGPPAAVAHVRDALGTGESDR